MWCDSFLISSVWCALSSTPFFSILVQVFREVIVFSLLVRFPFFALLGSWSPNKHSTAAWTVVWTNEQLSIQGLSWLFLDTVCCPIPVYHFKWRREEEPRERWMCAGFYVAWTTWRPSSWMCESVYWEWSDHHSTLKPLLIHHSSSVTRGLPYHLPIALIAGKKGR